MKCVVVTLMDNQSVVALEEEDRKAGIDGGMIPVPGELRKTCIFSWASPIREKKRLLQAIEEHSGRGLPRSGT